MPSKSEDIQEKRRLEKLRSQLEITERKSSARANQSPKKRSNTNRRMLHDQRSSYIMGRDYDNSRYIETLNQLLTSGVDFFLDSSVLFGFTKDRNIFSALKSGIETLDFPQFRAPAFRILGLYEQIVEFYQAFLERPNVHVLSGVRRETEAGFTMLEEKLNKKTTPSISPAMFNQLFQAHRQAVAGNARRFKETGAEEDPLEQRVYQLLPKYIETKRGTDNPSRVDRRLITVPFAMSAIDGVSKIIVSGDFGVGAVLDSLYHTLKDNPSALDVSGFQTSRLAPVRVNVVKFNEDTDNPQLEYQSGIKYSFN